MVINQFATSYRMMIEKNGDVQRELVYHTLRSDRDLRGHRPEARRTRGWDFNVNSGDFG